VPQLSRYDELIDPAAHLVVAPAIPPNWSTWDTDRRTIAVTWAELAAGLRASGLPEAIRRPLASGSPLAGSPTSFPGSPLTPA
jgi:hypothetical protein